MTVKCERCDDKGWYWRTPEGFNPFLAGGWTTARVMYKEVCSCNPPARAALEAKHPCDDGCQYAKDVGMLEHSCGNGCMYDRAALEAKP